MNIQLSNHAIKRAHQRFGLDRVNLERIVSECDFSLIDERETGVVFNDCIAFVVKCSEEKVEVLTVRWRTAKE